jgi:exo-beta-1,3-glucanase (GH17 family)
MCEPGCPICLSRITTILLLAISLLSVVGCGQISATTPIGTGTDTLLPTQTETQPPAPTLTDTPDPIIWEGEVSVIKWVAYSPTNADPDKGIEATPESIKQDLAVLRRAGFTGLVTYSSSGIIGQDLPLLAQEQGFKGLIVGIWDPNNQDEIAAAKAASQNPIVLGYCVGNEGLHKRYELSTLTAVIEELRSATGKYVTTTEEIDDYTEAALLALGDWVFPNAHPYFHSQLDPAAAVQWTAAAYGDISKRAGRFVIFKEVGLPTAGDTQSQLSEANQEQYYLKLAETNVKFVYFEAFDQTWKTTLPVEPYWGIFKADRTPKLLGYYLLGEQPPSTPTAVDTSFYVYRDLDFQGNHFSPTGYMGDIGDIKIDEAYTENTHSGTTAIRITYLRKGNSPNSCNYSPPCRWAGVYWQEPPNNWGTDKFWQDSGYDLSGYTRVLFWARADRVTKIEFKVGGIVGPYGDSLIYPRSKLANLTQEWQEFEIGLEGADLSHIIGGFVWVTNWEQNPGGVIFYLDDIRYMK